jgi:hypothetical protein
VRGVEEKGRRRFPKLSEKETARTIAGLRARLCEDDATIVQLSRVVRGACPRRGLGVCEKTGELCLDGSKWRECGLVSEAEKK